jgi:hypothetical protein
MCLYEEAHGVDASHPIFQGPFPVTPTLHDMETPAHYRRHPDGRDLGPTMPAWRVHRDEVSGYVGVVAESLRIDVIVPRLRMKFVILQVRKLDSAGSHIVRRFAFRQATPPFSLGDCRNEMRSAGATWRDIVNSLSNNR